jgi:CubicO group peptidase (beta-lactamase class C family)
LRSSWTSAIGLICLGAVLEAPLSHASGVWPTNGWATSTPAAQGMSQALLEQARDFTLTAGGNGIITRHGYSVLTWGSQTSRVEIKSATKSIGVSLLAMAIDDGLVGLDDHAQDHYAAFGTPPSSNTGTGWLDNITLHELATHTAGFDKAGGYIDLIYEPGTTWAYSDGGANWLADVLTVEFGDDLENVLKTRMLDPLGISGGRFDWRDNASRDDLIEGIPRREISSGIFIAVDSMARIGYLYLRNGQWNGQQILPAWFVAAASTVDPTIGGATIANPSKYPNATSHYGLLWWNNADGTMANVPTDAYWAWGLNENLIVVIPSLDIVAVRGGSSSWRSGWDGRYSAIEPFIEPIALSVLPAVSAGDGLQPSSWGTIKTRYRGGGAGTP